MADPAEREKLRLAVADLSLRAETALSAWSSQLRDRAKPGTGATSHTAAERIVAEDKLRQQLAELESEMALVQREYDSKAATTSFWDERAIVAMRHSDTVAAQEALLAHRRHADGLQELASELTILRALAKSCREVLSTSHDD